MKKAEILDLARRRGICVCEEHIYRIKVPVFTEGKDDPTGEKEITVKDIQDVERIVKEVWEDDEYRLEASHWVRSHW